VLRTSPGPDQRRASRLFRRPPREALPAPAPDPREPIAPTITSPTVGKSCVASKPVRAESICMVAATLPQSRGSLLAAVEGLGTRPGARGVPTAAVAARPPPKARPSAATARQSSRRLPTAEARVVSWRRAGGSTRLSTRTAAWPRPDACAELCRKRLHSLKSQVGRGGGRLRGGPGREAGRRENGEEAAGGGAAWGLVV
jgi:hypothetical protein